jgi:hypothetical protein
MPKENHPPWSTPLPPTNLLETQALTCPRNRGNSIGDFRVHLSASLNIKAAKK